jgi:N-acetylglucosamine-6-sulfatase
MPSPLRISRRDFLKVAGVTLLAGCSRLSGVLGSGKTGKKPNFLLIIVDDQTAHQMQFTPRTQALIFDQGAAFTSAFVTTPQCGPSRASILTGMYAHNHGVIDNSGDRKLELPTFIEAMHDHGYYTGHVGKYQNSYPRSKKDPPRPEYDSWVCMRTSPDGSRYYDPLLNINGEWVETEGYQTYLLRDFVIEFLQSASQQDSPFILTFTPYAPHQPAEAAPGQEKLFKHESVERPPNYNEEDVSDKPEWLQEGRPLLDKKQQEKIREEYKEQARALTALDEAIESILKELDELGLLDDTFILYTSDNGHFHGEHRLKGGKVFCYEEGVRVPFAIRYPALIPEPYVEEGIVANIDIAPTCLDLAGIPVPDEMDGRSIVSLLEGKAWREDVLLEAWPTGSKEAPPYAAVHTGQYVYVNWAEGKDEFYDLASDPYQMENQIDNPEYAEIIDRLSHRLKELGGDEALRLRP